MTPAIVSRCRVFQFEPLTVEDVEDALENAIRDQERGDGLSDVRCEEGALRYIAQIAGGDVRTALGALELAYLTTEDTPDPDTGKPFRLITVETAHESVQKPMLKLDESMYYDMLSAFIKSMRGSDPDAALLWFARLMYAGVDPKLIVRRIIVHASEDVGLADPTAMLQAHAAANALEVVGMPEARIPIAQAIIAVCESPKSNSVVMAIDRAMEDAQKGGYQSVPVHLRDTHYKGAEKIGSGEGYKYPHEYPGHWLEQQYAPLEAAGMPYYVPSEQGFESEIRKIRKTRNKIDPKDVQ
jgi:putative ATPase